MRDRDNFQPTNLEITSVDVGNPAVNVIPETARATFNLRFNDHWTPETLKAEIVSRLERAASDRRLRPAASGDIVWEISWRDRPSPCFLTRNDALSATLADAVEAVTGRRPQLSTSGGTSDARFIKNHCPVVEFGLVGQTMHMVDENVALADLEHLTEIIPSRHWSIGLRRHAQGDYVHNALTASCFLRMMWGRREGQPHAPICGGVSGHFVSRIVSRCRRCGGWVAVSDSDLGGLPRRVLGSRLGVVCTPGDRRYRVPGCFRWPCWRCVSPLPASQKRGFVRYSWPPNWGTPSRPGSWAAARIACASHQGEPWGELVLLVLDRALHLHSGVFWASGCGLMTRSGGGGRVFCRHARCLAVHAGFFAPQRIFGPDLRGRQG